MVTATHMLHLHGSLSDLYSRGTDHNWVTYVMPCEMHMCENDLAD